MEGWISVAMIAVAAVFVFIAIRTIILWYFGLDHIQQDLQNLRRTNAAQLEALNAIAAQLGAPPVEAGPEKAAPSS